MHSAQGEEQESFPVSLPIVVSRLSLVASFDYLSRFC